jgi:hypothetical protein
MKLRFHSKVGLQRATDRNVFIRLGFSTQFRISSRITPQSWVNGLAELRRSCQPVVLGRSLIVAVDHFASDPLPLGSDVKVLV